ncbi:hypothetical protein TNCV_4212781 [Trichonephila clavipes]|nr:hypothetical protein TNCV_4212781 [Trichonephila clavipes]
METQVYSIGVLWKFEEMVEVQVTSSLDHDSKLLGPSTITFVLLCREKSARHSLKQKILEESISCLLSNRLFPWLGYDGRGDSEAEVGRHLAVFDIEA